MSERIEGDVQDTIDETLAWVYRVEDRLDHLETAVKDGLAALTALLELIRDNAEQPHTLSRKLTLLLQGADSEVEGHEVRYVQ